MRKLVVFNHVSLDGYFVDKNGSMNWAKADHQDPEWDSFVAGNASGGGALVFGRVTYELMESFWPTPMAMEAMPAVAEGMNNMPKIVFSRTLDQVSWKNTKLVKGNLAAEIKKMKQETGPDMVILGSGSIVSQLAQEGLIDVYQIVMNPIALGEGRTLFEGVKDMVNLKLTDSRVFRNGNVVLTYELERK